ncbi:MAG TPA: hypothetical protein PKX38_01905 [Alphaproteobacteria bacterium]|nr:hypothetical protein [Alphaproteobacteria bacterium]
MTDLPQEDERGTADQGAAEADTSRVKKTRYVGVAPAEAVAETSLEKAIKSEVEQALEVMVYFNNASSFNRHSNLRITLYKRPQGNYAAGEPVNGINIKLGTWQDKKKLARVIASIMKKFDDADIAKAVDEPEAYMSSIARALGDPARAHTNQSNVQIRNLGAGYELETTFVDKKRGVPGMIASLKELFEGKRFFAALNVATHRMYQNIGVQAKIEAVPVPLQKEFERAKLYVAMMNAEPYNPEAPGDLRL